MIKAYFEFIKRWLSYYKVLRRAYDFDFSSIYKVEMYQIKRVRDCIKRYKFYEGYEHDVWYMNIALSLLDIYLNEEEEKYVNTKNQKRFVKYNANEGDFLKSELRKTKALYLYHKVRTLQTCRWWF